MEDFNKYAKSDYGISSLSMYRHNQQIEDSLTPYILEERKLQVTQLDIFSRLLMDRIIWIAGPINETVSTIVQAQLMFLDSLEVKDITMHIDTPGGYIKSGLSMVDVMDYIKSDIITVNTGMAASMGSVLLGAGTKGKRHSLRFSRVMMHQASGSYNGNIQDAKVSMAEFQKYNEILFDLLGGYCGKDAKQIKEDATRDYWLNAEAAKEYGIIDNIIIKKK